MATLALAAAGAAVGSAVLPAGISVFGATLTGAAIGTQVGALAGSVIDQALFGPGQQSHEGPRLDELRVTTSTEGAPIPKVYGAARLGGQVIWTDDFEEVVSDEEVGGGKGSSLGGGGGATSTTYSYFASFAVAIAEGEISGLGRVWADNEDLDLSQVTYRVYTGSEDQAPDSLIAAHHGPDATPAFRGLAYIVFERLPLGAYGNRLPQLSFEVFRATDDFSSQVRGVVMIPGSGEFVYATTPVSRVGPDGAQVSDNVHSKAAKSDIEASLDQLQATLPNVSSISLVTSWFGDDLRAGACQLRPGVDRRDKPTDPLDWRVAGQNRASAYLISSSDGRPNYGGTPDDQSVIEAIREIKARGIGVTLNPFILMDVPPETTLPNPYDPGSVQPAFPWRGRITIDPAPGVAGSPDKSAAAATSVSAFVGSAATTEFGLSGDSVTYAGPAEWSYRRMILHYAYLAKAAGGVDAFLIGSELRGLTSVRDGASSYPFVAALVALAADVKAILGPATKVTYAADWSEYFGHQPGDGSGDVHFHLDPLWASPDIDAIGIDCYWPLSDWRDGPDHADRTITSAPTDLGYLKANLTGGEGHDWYYASTADRAAQVRTPITDGSGKPWIYRFKDIGSWWSNPHFDRPAGIEAAQPTAWVPQSKPIWLMELGCPAIDKGANQPNVFYDPKSSESAQPYFSTGAADELIQRRYIQAFVEAFDADHAGYVAGLNPVSSVYGGRMLDTTRTHIYAWDARPFPAFPYDTETWADGPKWQTGHWLNGRASANDLADVLRQLFADFGFAEVEAEALKGLVPGFVVDRPMALRNALQTLELAYFLDIHESGGKLRIRHRADGVPALTIAPGDTVETEPGASLISVTRGQETDLPRTIKLSYVARDGDYAAEIAEARRTTRYSSRESTAELALMLDERDAGAIAATWLYETWAQRERAALSLPPSAMALEPGDQILLDVGNRQLPVRISDIADHGPRAIDAVSVDRDVYSGVQGATRETAVPAAPLSGKVDLHFLDLPLLSGTESPEAAYIAASQTPWPGAISVYKTATESGYQLATTIAAPAVMGRLQSVMPTGVGHRWNHGASVDVKLTAGALEGRSQIDVINGSNVAAVQHVDGQWEVIQFASAELIGPRTYRLSTFLRGQSGTETAAMSETAAGAAFVLLNGRVARLDLSPSDIKRAFSWRYGPAGRDFGGPDFRRASHAFDGVGARPFAPVHVRGARSPAGLALSWTRRTRAGGDSWEQREVPLAEDGELYEVDILNGETVVRTLTSGAPAATYAAADAAADFGAMPEAVTCRIYQVGASYGRGTPAIATV